MAEYIREVVVSIEVDTNKHTYTRQIAGNAGETHEEFEQRVLAALGELLELS